MLNIALQTNGSATPKRSNTITQYTNPKITSTQSSVDNFTMSLTKEETGNERGKFDAELTPTQVFSKWSAALPMRRPEAVRATKLLQFLYSKIKTMSYTQKR